MEDANVTPFPSSEKDEYKARIERTLRNLESLVQLSDRLAAVQFKYYASLKEAGFDDYDAREMAKSLMPSYLG